MANDRKLSPDNNKEKTRVKARVLVINPETQTLEYTNLMEFQLEEVIEDYTTIRLDTTKPVQKAKKSDSKPNLKKPGGKGGKEVITLNSDNKDKEIC